MRTIDRYNNQNDEYVHPFWLGISLLFSVMIIIGLVCCVRVKYGKRLSHLCNRLFGRNISTNENNTNDDGHSMHSHFSHTWSSNYTPTRSQSPKLYTLVKNIRRAKLQKQLAVRQQSSNEDDNDNEVKPTIESDHHPQISISPSSDITRNSEIARKFYASMRNTSQCQNSSSLDSYNNDASLTSNTPSLSFDEPKKPRQEGHLRIFRAPRFFQTIPNQDKLIIAL